mgnify:CR=1 FL=1
MAALSVNFVLRGSAFLGHGFLELLLSVDIGLLLLLGLLHIASFAFEDSSAKELVLSLGLVRTGTRHEHASSHKAGGSEDGNGVDSELGSVLDTELEASPPVEGVESPEEDKGEDNTEVVLPGVLVHTLIVAGLDGVVSETLAVSL